MPSDLIVNVRQIANYPVPQTVYASDQVLLQQGGLGGPYVAASTEQLVTDALAQAGPLGVGTYPPPGDETQIFTNNFITAPEGGILFNLYFNGTTAAVWQAGFCGGMALDGGTGILEWELGSGQPTQPAVLEGAMSLDQAGNLYLPRGTLTVARDPAGYFDVATMGWVSNNTVGSFNARKGAVVLNAQDVYSALNLCDPIATQPWVINAINNSIQNLLWTCSFVNTWNGRSGSVYLMLSDITCVFYQSGQQPISPTPLPNSNDDSIATTKWVINAFQPDGGTFLPISGGTMLGPLTVTASNATTARSVQDEFADVANVLDFGADPTGVNDSAPAINAAAAQRNTGGTRRRSVYLPTGLYLIKSQISLSDGQSLYGDAPGNSVIVVNDSFDPAAASVIVCTQSFVDPGPTIRDLYFWLQQPDDVTQRSTFRTLANGGTSGNGGTGVQYPWVIATSGNSGRIQVRHVYIAGGWNGIEANGACYWIDDLRTGCFNINISVGGTIAAPVADWTHFSDIEVWTFGINTPGPLGVFMDGNTIALQIGAQNGLEAQNISCFGSQVIFTADAEGGWFDFTNLSLDTDQATLNMVNCGWANFANIYLTADDAATRAQMTFSGGVVNISNLYAHTSSPFAAIAVNGADVSIGEAHLRVYNVASPAVAVTAPGTLRISNSRIYPGTAAAWTAPLVQQGGGAVLQLTNVDMRGIPGSSGVAVQFNADVAGNVLAGVTTPGPNWRNVITYGDPPLGNYSTAGVLVASQDATSMQVGGNAFAGFGASAHDSTAFGYIALNNQGDGAANNTAMGAFAGYGLTTGSANTLLGSYAGFGPITGSSNTVVGQNAGYSLTSGSGNTIIGVYADQATLTSGSGNIIIGENLGVPSGAATSNHLSIGNVVQADAINTPTAASGSLYGTWHLPQLPGTASYADDAAAAAGGVAVGQLYRNASAVQVRVT